MIFQIEFLTEDKNLRELCVAYWLTNARGKFVNKVSELENLFGLEQNKVAGLVQSNCHAFHKEMVCKQCGKPTRYFDKPLIAYEYQGSYHRDHDQAEKDAFKRAILNEVGLPLEEITNADLQRAP